MTATSSTLFKGCSRALLSGLILLVTSASGSLAQGDPQTAREIHLPPEILEEFGVEFAVAGAGRLDESITLAGEIQPNADRLARISPRYEGLITSVGAEIGDQVGAGQVLCTVEGNQSLSEYELRTLIGGTVISKDIVQGESVDRDRILFSVADLSTVWLDLTVYQRDLPRLAKGQRVEVYLGHDEMVAEAEISYISPVLDQATRTGVARAVLRNPAGHWRLGMFVTARVSVGGWEVPLAVEREAIFEIDGQRVIFVRNREGVIEVRTIRSGKTGHEFVEILEGLLVGESYAHRGGFVLKAELGKDQLDDGHGH